MFKTFQSADQLRYLPNFLHEGTLSNAKRIADWCLCNHDRRDSVHFLNLSAEYIDGKLSSVSRIKQ